MGIEVNERENTRPDVHLCFLRTTCTIKVTPKNGTYLVIRQIQIDLSNKLITILSKNLQTIFSLYELGLEWISCYHTAGFLCGRNLKFIIHKYNKLRPWTMQMVCVLLE